MQQSRPQAFAMLRRLQLTQAKRRQALGRLGGMPHDGDAGNGGGMMTDSAGDNARSAHQGEHGAAQSAGRRPDANPALGWTPADDVAEDAHVHGLVAAAGSGLRALRLAGCRGLTSASALSALASGCDSLEELDLSGFRICMLGFDALLAVRNLTALRLDGCRVGRFAEASYWGRRRLLGPEAVPALASERGEDGGGEAAGQAETALNRSEADPGFSSAALPTAYEVPPQSDSASDGDNKDCTYADTEGEAMPGPSAADLDENDTSLAAHLRRTRRRCHPPPPPPPAAFAHTLQALSAVDTYRLEWRWSQFRSLRTLSLSHATSETLWQLAELPHLRELELTRSEYLPPDGLAQLGRLEVLRLTRCSFQAHSFFPPRPSWAGLADVLEGLGQLHTLALHHVLFDTRRSVSIYRLDDALVAVLPRAPLPHLGRLSLCGPGLGDHSLLALGEHCPSLTALAVEGAEDISDMGVAALARSCPGLRELRLPACASVTDAALEALADSCQHLEELNISRWERVLGKGSCYLCRVSWCLMSAGAASHAGPRFSCLDAGV
jgi:hypothetical protein